MHPVSCRGAVRTLCVKLRLKFETVKRLCGITPMAGGGVALFVGRNETGTVAGVHVGWGW